MATYEIKSADGAVYNVDGPEGADPSDVIAQVTAAHTAGTTPGASASAAPAPASPPPTFGAGFRATLSAMLPSSLTGAMAIPQVARQMASSTVAAPVAGIAGMGTAAARAAGLTSASPADVVRGVQSALTLQPTSPGSQTLSSVLNFLPGKFAQGADWAGGKVAQATNSPALGAAVNTGIQALPMALGARYGASRATTAPRTVLPTGAVSGAQDALTSASMSSPQSVSAAAAAPSLADVSPQLRQAISTAAQKAGGAINPDVLQRHVQADTLPVSVQLTEGQAHQDPVLISEEQNLRGVEPSLAKRFNGQNQQLVDNLQALRDSTGPEVFSTNPTEHGDTLIDAYQAKNDAAQAAIAEKYKALKDANGGQFPVDVQALKDNAVSQLHKQLLFDHAPRPIMNTLNTLADNGSMTFEQYEALRTNLARLMRSSPDGNAIAAAGVIRNAMEELPLAPGAASLKPLADQARAAARAQFQALDADPAYKAAVYGTVTPDRFVGRFVTGGARDALTTMRQNLADDPTALQTLGVATIDHLRRAAGIADNGAGNFTQAGFNKALQNLSPKLGALVDPTTAETLQNLGDVARYTQAQPRGAYVNNSNSTVARIAKYGGGAIEHGVNMAFHGVPVGTIGRGALQQLSTAKRAQQALAPGAGLSRLNPSADFRPMGAAPLPPRGTMPGSFGSSGP